jgi:hypothetical protein
MVHLRTMKKEARTLYMQGLQQIQQPTSVAMYELCQLVLLLFLE